ncbi:hypothetical protein K450DRAFT_284029 [Umbelopsis ramanniana AG]|uniref:GH18 domain-containing protein n=1 Tax=Umbelopsis ramanniana AG TaxID=1314678 RepID=A0AAD5HAJ1_UMBRA|nr:uncharacterized protein K450DRAFT_284029 [Umbelopsis ramanniana AG]KAI8575804.1 hypothetical protein K450DRAFT_284029 [Umbelopsis ramanniana AG]
MKLTSAIALCGLLSQVSAKMVVGYFPNWLYANYPVEKIPVNKYTHINYAFAILNKDDMVPAFTDDWAVESSLPKLVNNTHTVGSKVLLSVGGWTGSIKFSKMVAKAENRKKFIDWNLNFISKYNTDGVDIDWEYPGRQAAGCNEFDAKNDASNFLILLKELRAALDKKFPKQHKEITMAVHVYPFQTEKGYMESVKDFVPFFDHINIMSYDINGAWGTTTGPNAPLYHEEGKGEQVSFASSIKNWIDAGVPAAKINAGLAYYGRSIKTAEDMKDNQYVSSVKGAPKGDSDDAYWQDPSCNAEEGGFSGIWKYTNLRSQGILDKDGKPGAGYTKHWDPISSTPWLFNEMTKTYISYEDKDSLMHKVELALCLDIGGVMAW